MCKQTKLTCLYKQIKLSCLYIQIKILCMYTQIKGFSPLFMLFYTKYLFCLHTQTNYFAYNTCACASCARARICFLAKYLVFGVCGSWPLGSLRLDFFRPICIFYPLR